MKNILLFLFLIITFLFPKDNILAQEASPFISDHRIIITVNEGGLAHVNQQITVTNQTVDYYLKSFVVSLGFKNFSDIKVYGEGGTPIAYSLKEEDDTSLLTLTPPKGVVGIGNKNVFNIEFDSADISRRKGLMWEIVIPGVEASASLGQYNLTLSVPQNFGPPMRSPSANPEGFYQFNFDKGSLLGKGQIINFGKYQRYNFDITYALKNAKLLGADMSVTLPPTIPNVQKVFFESITPQPKRFEEDQDGNQLAYFRVPGGKVLNPRIKGQIVVFSNVNNLSSSKYAPTFPYTQEDEFWPVNNPEIINTADNLETPGEVYDFVVEKLVYKEGFPGDALVRKGALRALVEGEGVCTEYTDLLVTLLRAKGIAAQSLAGFSYTEESSSPLLNTEDDRVVLHSWVRWYDPDKGWQYADPTWGNTTGLDYFTKFDTNHIVFAIHGKSSVYPYSAGSYIEGESDNLKDKVDITFADSEPEGENMLSFEQLANEANQRQSSKIVLWEKILALLFALATGGAVVGFVLYRIRSA